MPSYRTIPKLLQTSTCQESLIERGYYEQDVNFSYRQTADAHDSQATTNATMALIKSLKGRSIAWNQLIQNGNFSNGTTGWSATGYASFSVANGTGEVHSTNTTANAKTASKFVSSMNLTVGHKYFISSEIKVSDESVNAFVGFAKSSNASVGITDRIQSLNFTKAQTIVELQNTATRFDLRLDNSAAIDTVAYFKNVMLIDLTLLYGSGNEPTTAEEFETDYQNWFGKKLTYEPYSAGEIRNFSMSGIKTTGFNQCVYPVQYRASIPSFSETYYTKVIGGVPYHVSFNISGATSWRINMRAYDLYGTLITEYSDVRESSTIGWYYNSSAKAFLNGSNNTTTSFDITFAQDLYVLFFIQQGDTSSSTTVSNFTLNFKRNDVRDGDYEAHVEQTGGPNITLLTGKLNGSGNSVSICPNGLLQAGDVRDEIYIQDGKRWFAKRVGTVDLGTLSWNYKTTGTGATVAPFFYAFLVNKGNNALVACAKYEQVDWNKFSSGDNKSICTFWAISGSALMIRDTSYTTTTTFKAAMSGVILNYELATTEYYLLDNEWQQDSAWSYNVDDWGTEEVVNSSIGVSTPIEGTIKYYNPLRQYSYGLRQNEIACVHDAQVVKEMYKDGSLYLKNIIWDFFPVNIALSDNGQERYFRVYSTIEGKASQPSITNVGSRIQSARIVDKSNDGNYIICVKTDGTSYYNADPYAVTLSNNYGVSFNIYLLPPAYWSIGEITFANAITLCEYFFIGSPTPLSENSLDPGYIFRAPRLQGYNFSRLATYSNPAYGFPASSMVTFTYPTSTVESLYSPIHICHYDLSDTSLDGVYTPMYNYNGVAKGSTSAHPSNFVTGQYIYIIKRTGKLLTVQNNNSSNNGFTIYSNTGVPEYSKVTINLAGHVPSSEYTIVEIPNTILGLVSDPAIKFNIFFNGKDITYRPTSSKRACIMIKISDKFPALPSEYLYHKDGSDTNKGGLNSSEALFIRNNVLTEDTEIGGTDVKAFILRMVSTSRVTHFSSGILCPPDNTITDVSWRITEFAWTWTIGPATSVHDVSELSTYSASNKYYLIANFKKNSDQTFSVAPVYREDFDVIIVPNTWDIKTVLSVRIFQNYFNVTNQWAGGMAIYGEYLVQFFTSGRVLILQKKNMNVIASGAMEGATSTYAMHCNAISFSSIIPQGGSFPYIYISEWTSGHCNCHVETMSISGTNVTMSRVQKISYSGSKFNTSLNWDWSVDVKTGYLWCYGYAASASDRYGAKIALKFPLPSPTSGDVTYTDSNIVDQFSFTFEGAQQDVHIENDMMFYEFSYNVTGGRGGILLINLKTKQIYTNYIISLEDIEREPEGICRDGSILYVSSHSGANNFDLAVHTIDLLQSNFNK